MTERLQKILSARGICSRRKAEELILSGRVSVNGVPAVLGSTADAEIDKILVDGKPLPLPQNHVYIMLHKPKGYVTTLSDEKGRKNVAELVSECGRRVFPVGRLDMDSEGLLLLTDDGDLANRIMHPKGEINKIYTVNVSKFTAEGLEKLKKPATLDGYTIRTPGVLLLSEKNGKAILQITIHEGRNRQIRRMCELAGMYVTRLVRIQEGTLKLGKLPCGQWRYLSEEEITALKKET